ncbi:MAG: DUF4335 domain-containing protein [Oscillatoriales cyanobacterium]|nr:MAG: DUF4335 domain-containing protein [Oscillatoriales cyanobacterium]
MSVRRKYSLPGCTLILEGVTTETGGRRPTISAVVNAECHLLGHSQILAGGQGFLQQLTETLSAYTQSLLSGIVPVIPEGHITIEPLPPLQHRLTITDPGLEAPVSLDLSTLQLFDLLESLDQMLADARTLPGWSLDLKPLTRHQARLDPPIAERATPAAIGLSSLAVAAVALFFLPIPEVRRPSEPIPVSAEEQAQTTTPDEAAGSAPPTDLAAETTNASKTGDRPDAKRDQASGQTVQADPKKPKVPQASSDKPKSSTETKAKSPTAETSSTTKPAIISDSDQLYALSLKLDQDLSANWNTDQAPTGDREYRVSVGQDGAIIGYIGRSEGAESYVDSTPLPDLLYVPTEAGSAKVEAQADFRVVFADSGTIEVSPWDGYAKTPSTPPSLTDAPTVTQSLDDLSTTLYDKFKDDPSFDRSLAYRLGVTAEGTLAQVEPLTADARSFYGETPLPDLYDPAAAIAVTDDRVTLMPLVEFRVVFQPNGVIEIAPWYGMQ